MAVLPSGQEIRWSVTDPEGLAAGDTVWAHAPRGGRAVLAAFVDPSGTARFLRPRDTSPVLVPVPKDQPSPA